MPLTSLRIFTQNDIAVHSLRHDHEQCWLNHHQHSFDCDPDSDQYQQ